MRLGGFVIHGDSAATLPACLDSLAATCDTVLAVDSGATDGSADLVRARGFRRLEHPWEGYGSARAAAVAALSDCDWVFYLDSDERLPAASIDALRRWRESPPTAPAYRVALEDWVELPTRRFRLRTHWRKRLFRRDVAGWTRDMLIHESVDVPGAGRLPIAVEHRFATSLDDRAGKHDRYALLWAVQAFAHGRPRKSPGLQQPAQALKLLVGKGALFRGGWDAARVAWNASAYHSRKYVWLERLGTGAHAELVTAYREGRYRALLALVADAVPVPATT